MRGPPGTREVLVRYALRQAYNVAWRRLLASRRWSGAQKADALFAGGIAVAFVALPVIVVTYGWWFWRGRGPVRWLGSARCVNVDPWRRHPFPADLQEGIRTMNDRARARAEQSP